MPKRDDGAAASSNVFAESDLDETGNGDALLDNALMQAVAQANQKAFSILMRRHVPTMVALARRITLNVSDADEIVQEAFLRVWVNAPRWDVDGTALFRTWLHRIVTNLAIDRRRKPQSSPLEAAGDPPDPLKDTAGDLERSDEAQQVRRALAQLPPRQRAAIALCYLEEMTAMEAAKILGLSTGATEALLVRARRSLRNILAFIKNTKEGEQS